jgi:HPt (histidine-containing phosphotransfer) domain-containing protein
MVAIRNVSLHESPGDGVHAGSGAIGASGRDVNGLHAAELHPTGPQGICQPEEAMRRLGGLPDLYADIVGRLLDDAAGIFARLQAAVDAEDISNAHASAHSLKGLALMCGAVSVADAARAMEDATRPGGSPAWRPLMTRIADEMALARVLLTPYR